MSAATASTMPVVILKTERLTLRAFTEADIDDVYAAVRDPLIQTWLPLPEPGVPYTRADAEEWCLTGAPESRAGGDGQNWAVTDRRTGRFLGSVGLTRTMWVVRSTEVGYWTAPWSRGTGVAAEAVTAVSRWALDQGLERVVLRAATANTASRRVAEKSGFAFEGIERNAMLLHEGRADLALYSLIPSDLGKPPEDGTR
ncbi:RimJ/RimL family protein N-acetyltransferase [Nocardiopsis mwathae]|uniref:RimJ/RimL family protein N-acetyltransferase n=1 Tax=Nocardiopsis mwathae TaxID=1472723 RepID=A0A7W9YIN8_9ACTN|nr:GNAT family N-acetyltransferase [Nocardiopsis mwathae]MBB6172855.1 RimJ/RimL family protein N-acetyltransferase [Nocardiopsis mwathae]